LTEEFYEENVVSTCIEIEISLVAYSLYL